MKLVKLAFEILVIILILSFAAASVGYVRRASLSDSAFNPATNAAVLANERYALDASQSKFIAHAMAGGLLWFKGHDHLVAVREFTGEAQLIPEQVNRASLEIKARAASMVETNSVFSDQQKQIIDKELREIVLQPDQYPDITFRSTQVSGQKTANGAYDLKSRVI